MNNFDKRILSVQEYLEIIGVQESEETKQIKSLNELRDFLDKNGHENYWDFPLSEVDIIKENNHRVVKVDDTEDCRWFQLPDGKENNYLQVSVEL